MCKITFYNSQKDLSLSLPHCRKAIGYLLKYLKINTDELIIHFVSTKKICLLHQTTFNDPTPTDCISFPLDAIDAPRIDYHVLGEIFICTKVAATYALQHNLRPQEELMRYIIHGILHLIGYDDMTPADYKKMKQREKNCLYYLDKSNLLSKIIKTL